MKKNLILNAIVFILFWICIKSENNNTNITENDKLINEQIEKSNENKNNNESISEIIIKKENINNGLSNINQSRIFEKEDKNTTKEFNDDIDINKIDFAEHIIIINKHEDQLVESIFYFLSFVLIIYIILFLYKFYKCYCENTIKEFGEDNGMKNPQNDPELQRISTTDDENIVDNNKNIKEEEDE